MTSDRKIIANRSNATRSTGPRSAAGKARSSVNALRHGLTASLANDPSKLAEVDQLAHAIAGIGSTPIRLFYARIVAEAEVDIIRVRAARVALLKRVAIEEPAHVKWKPSESQSIELLMPMNPVQHTSFPAVVMWELLAFERASSGLAKLDRYERHALSRRTRAIRTLDLGLDKNVS